ncbi:hypothetical protein [Micromonospora sp. C95]|uniref:hypothetical protein n=1 Tax=Micromonospora sp. C95 TaxID=2824882 RepID=UPI001B35AE3A|nr:hypothetical protein [Micromonospora sp. C95]MBQ1025854.1 hypothetical protein [Micromonospora sp. C95]
MADRKKAGGDSRLWYWPSAMLLGLVIGVMALDGAAGIGVGIAIGIALALALGAADREDDADDADEPGPGEGPDRRA